MNVPRTEYRVPRKNNIKNFRELEVWQLGRKIVMETYKLTRKFPKEELFSLVNQMRRSAISILSNIAEGFNRYHNKEFRQFLYVSRGSCAELETQIEVANDLGYIDDSECEKLLEHLDHISRMLRNLIKKIADGDIH